MNNVLYEQWSPPSSVWWQWSVSFSGERHNLPFSPHSHFLPRLFSTEALFLLLTTDISSTKGTLNTHLRIPFQLPCTHSNLEWNLHFKLKGKRETKKNTLLACWKQTGIWTWVQIVSWDVNKLFTKNNQDTSSKYSSPVQTVQIHTLLF